MKTFLTRTFLAVGLLFAASGCGKKDDHAGHDHAAHKHEHTPPHGGTPVVLGKEAFHLELVLDPAAGKLSAYVLDGEMEGFVRLALPGGFTVVATIAGKPERLTFSPVGNAATGETPADTSLFEATAPWLKTTPIFDAVVETITVRGQTFTGVAFNFPRGNDTDH